MELSIIYYIKFDRVFTHKKKEFDYFYNEVAYTLKLIYEMMDGIGKNDGSL